MSVKKNIPVADLADINEIALRLNEKPNTVRKWILRYADFPTPCRTFSIGAVYDYAQVKRWHGRKFSKAA